jgi:hypothetical protein
VTTDHVDDHTTQGTVGSANRLDQNTQPSENDEHIFLTPSSVLDGRRVIYTDVISLPGSNWISSFATFVANQ